MERFKSTAASCGAAARAKARIVTLGPNKDHINKRILQTMISDILVILGLGTRMSDPYVYVVFWAPNCRNGSGTEPLWKCL